MNVGSLFSGIGGLDLGLERAGMTVRWQVEIDAYCRKVLAKHWPDGKRNEDVRECGKHNLEPVDLVCGGFPCQDLSVAGKRRGLAGERSGLFWELVRVASELRPAWLVLENVPGVLSSNDGKDFALVLGGVTGMVPEVPGGGWRNRGITVGLPDRWSAAWRVLDSQWFGVAQRRRRVFIVGHLDARRAGAVLFEPEGSQRHSAPVRKTGTDIAHALDARTGGVSAKENQETLVFNHQAGGSRDFTGCATKPGALHAGQTPAVACSPSDAHRVREVAGLPRGMDGRRHRALGNAVTVSVAEWIGRRVLIVNKRES